MDHIYEQKIQPMEPKLIRAAWRVLGDEHEAGDALQDALARIWKHRWQLESHPNPSAWMLRIVLHAAYDRLRLRKVQRTEVLPAHLESSDPSPSSLAQQHETTSALLDEIGRLSPKQSQAVLLRLVEDMPYAAIAEALGCNESTARVHVQRARERLRQRFAHLEPLSRRSQQ
jgi:RNA polymerase sigma-70 factor (ECF subfamily)